MKTIRLMPRRWLLAAALGIATASPVFALPAGGPAGSYDIKKDFNFIPRGGIANGVWRYLVATSVAAPQKHCQHGLAALPLPPAGQVIGCNSSTPAGAKADAMSSIIPSAFNAASVAGQVRAFGDASVPPDVDGRARSAARSGVRVNGNNLMLRGKIRVKPNMELAVTGKTGAKVMDPISFDILDTDTGLLTMGTLESLDAELNGTGSFSWANDLFAVDAQDFTFSIDLDSSFIPVSERGTVDFKIDDGIVTTSTATGIFAGLLPTVGSSGKFSTPFSNDLTLDYDFGSLGGANPLVGINIDDAGSAAVIPVPGTLLLACTGLALMGLTRRRNS